MKGIRLNTNNMMKRLMLIITLFAISMGLLETAVVIYLREILYPGGFEFPLQPIQQNLFWTEVLRELATLVMLLTVGMLTGKTARERFAWFLYAFAVWDIFYYVFLWALIGWPESLMTWDVLFLIPVTWTGPVLSPILVSGTMILFAMLIIFTKPKGSEDTSLSIPRLSWILLISGSLILITAFTWDYSSFILESQSFRDIWTLPESQLLALAQQYIPRSFNWLLFSLGEAIILSGIYVFWHKSSDN